MIGYKLFRERKDGTLGPLFINHKQKIELGIWYHSESHRTKGFSYRPGWHICRLPNAPHLSMKDRAWCVVEFDLFSTISRPVSQGGIWYLGYIMKVLDRL